MCQCPAVPGARPGTLAVLRARPNTPPVPRAAPRPAPGDILVRAKTMSRLVFASILLAAASALSASAQTSPGASGGLSLYVSPSGNDNNSGRAAREAFATLTRARDEARRLRLQMPSAPVTVYLAGGLHLLREPVVFSPQDSKIAYDQSQYWVNVEGDATVAKMPCVVLRFDAKQLDVAYPLQKWYVRLSDGLPVKVENFSASGTLLRTTYYVDYQKVADGKFLFSKLLGVDALQKGQQTFLTNEGISTAKIPDYTFSKAFLEEQSR